MQSKKATEDSYANGWILIYVSPISHTRSACEADGWFVAVRVVRVWQDSIVWRSLSSDAFFEPACT